MVEGLKKAGKNAKITSYDKGHGGWDIPLSSKEFYQFMLSYKNPEGRNAWNFENAKPAEINLPEPLKNQEFEVSIPVPLPKELPFSFIPAKAKKGDRPLIVSIAGREELATLKKTFEKYPMPMHLLTVQIEQNKTPLETGEIFGVEKLILEHLQTKPVDSRQVSLMGSGRGGNMVWELLSRRGQGYSAAAVLDAPSTYAITIGRAKCPLYIYDDGDKGLFSSEESEFMYSTLDGDNEQNPRVIELKKIDNPDSFFRNLKLLQFLIKSKSEAPCMDSSINPVYNPFE